MMEVEKKTLTVTAIIIYWRNTREFTEALKGWSKGENYEYHFCIKKQMRRARFK